MRLLTFGGRDYNDRETFFRHLDRIDRDHCIDVIIEGGALGADRLGREWALARDVRHVTFEADWKTHQRRSGPMRNQRMIEEGMPTHAIAAPGGVGTDDMTRRVRAAGIPLIEIPRT